MIKGNKIYAILNPEPGYYTVRPAIFLGLKFNKEYCNAYVEHETGVISFEQCLFSLTYDEAKKIAKEQLVEWKERELDRINKEEFKLKHPIQFDGVEAYYEAHRGKGI